MSGTAVALAALGLCFAGMAALSLAMDRHHARLGGTADVPFRRRIVLRLLAGMLLALALIRCQMDLGMGAGTATWAGALSIGVLAVAALLAHAPRLFVAVAATAGLLSVLGWMLAGQPVCTDATPSPPASPATRPPRAAAAAAR